MEPTSVVPPTNRSRNTPNIAHPPEALIDTLAVRSRISRDSFEDAIRLARKSGTKGVLHLLGGVRLRVDQGRGHPEAGLEFSVPRLLTGDNSHASPLADACKAFERAWAGASDLVSWVRPMEDATIMRLDLVRDFEAEPGCSEAHLAGLSRIPASRAQTVAFHAPDGPGVETVYRKTTRWDARLYLRDALPHTEVHMRAAHETVRFELQMRSTMLQERGLSSLAALEVQELSELAHERFVRCRFHVPVGDPEAKLRAAMVALEHLSTVDRRGLLGQLQLDALGLPFSPRDKTVQKYRRLAATNGLSPADVLQGVLSQGTPLRRFDYARGTLEVMTAAAA